jgi:hypothetical protein
MYTTAYNVHILIYFVWSAFRWKQKIGLRQCDGKSLDKFPAAKKMVQQAAKFGDYANFNSALSRIILVSCTISTTVELSGRSFSQRI